MSRTTSVSPARARILEATLALITKRGGADVTMAEIASAARVSRQAVYLHFDDRAKLLMALVRYVDDKRGLDVEVRKITEARDGVAAIRAAVALQTRMNPGIWSVVRAFDAVRRRDPAVGRSWQDRHRRRLEGARRIVAKLAREHTLRRGLDVGTAADLVWSLTSLRTWEDLVLERGWSAEAYERRITKLLVELLVGKREARTARAERRKP